MDWLEAGTRLKAHYFRTCLFFSRDVGSFSSLQILKGFPFKWILTGSHKRQIGCNFKFMLCLDSELKEEWKKVWCKPLNGR